MNALLQRATSWRLRSLTLDCRERPLLMGIVNVTPDSFSDGGKFADTDAALHHALQLVSDGADLLDIGGESTRPYADPVGVQQELDRVAPVIERLAMETLAPISIDTGKAAVASEAIKLGAQVINDVTGLEGDPGMLPLAVDSGAGICVMHMQGTPQTMQDAPEYDNVVEEIHGYLQDRRDALLAAGVAAERICLDPGIGFGKAHKHNLTLMSQAERFLDLGCPILVGHSRKGFLGKLLGDKGADRTAATVGAALSLAAQRVQVIRVHDVRPVREALLAFQACGGCQPRADADINDD